MLTPEQQQAALEFGRARKAWMQDITSTPKEQANHKAYARLYHLCGAAHIEEALEYTGIHRKGVNYARTGATVQG